MSNAGRIKIEVGPPHPAWCDVYVDGIKVARLDHRELSDLKYATEKAIQEARIVLKNRAHEV